MTDNDTIGTPPPADAGGYGPPPLRRPYCGRMLAGVATGLADHLGLDVTVVRLVMVLLTFLGGAGIPLYLAGWLLIPDEGAEQSIAGEWVGHAG